ncbi:helix-turn-helix transcriptional regulator [Sphingobium sp. HBC34]|uniref:Helix-turn-helix transcriptional regulator n=1 Tax=Sphingobium cyanobacteriorum TaxID=3063954 RepID=A0ABT8ZPY9_9SPHN|nr:helix-turn-helix transcriptional regulator [Sphingobium sp. HBC34]MDO7835571.1 helix-turn-helix transcriptional regulator [Sphingobium sp. HBC34]
METGLGTQILPELYGCCEHPGNWRPLLDRICTELGARSAAVQIYRQDGGYLSIRWQERDSYSHAHASQHDRWINNPDNPRLLVNPSILPKEMPSVLTDKERFVPGSPELQETRQRLAQIGLKGGTGILMEFAPSHYFSLILHRHIDDKADQDRLDAAFLGDIGPHLLSLARISAKLRTACATENMLTAIMDQLRVGIVSCTAAGQVRWHNRAADKMLGRGAALTVGNGWLRGCSPDNRNRLTGLLSPSGVDEVAAARFCQSDGGAIQAIALPADALCMAEDGWRDTREERIVILTDCAHMPFLSLPHVMSLFGLTCAEAQLSIALCQGLSLDQYAMRKGISVGTVRIQMKRILAKTDSRRQADLVGKLCNSVIAQVNAGLH